MLSISGSDDMQIILKEDSGVITEVNVEDHIVQEPSVGGSSVSGDGKFNII